jgi:coproporphyrinogen III oxidase-like Fe-S oxidoreductase
VSALPPTFLEFLTEAPRQLDTEAIVAQWRALRPPCGVEERRPPLPLWARRGLTDNGAAAWAQLRRQAATGPPGRAMCVYVHLPFCARRCAFCDCYSFTPRSRTAEHLGAYAGLLEREVAAWSSLGTLADRPVSTVHLGGGTPTLMAEADLSRLVASIRAHFNVDPRTEWALESTTSEFGDGMMAALESAGFTRLHLGVQTLQDEVRQRIGRREPAATVLAKIERAVSRGWMVSVDAIVGLPGQNAAGLVADLASLEAAGADGLSVYELQFSRRNLPFARRTGLTGRGRLGPYLLFQAAALTLEARGYRKTLFNHWAKARDTNLYFTFPERDEDCLAMGTIADGVFGDYHYRHPEYAAYRCSFEAGGAFLQGGLRRMAGESALRPLEVSLLSGRPRAALFASVLGAGPATALFTSWQAAALVEPGAAPGEHVLTGNGSWLAGNMLEQALAGGPAG